MSLKFSITHALLYNMQFSNDREQLLSEAEQMINKCIRVQLYKMAAELVDVDHHVHSRAVTAGEWFPWRAHRFRVIRSCLPS